MSVYETLPQPDQGVHIHRGYFARDVPDLNTKAYAILPNFDKGLQFGPCMWQPRGSTLPKKGDDCLVLLDNGQQPWVSAWWPKIPGTTFNADTLDGLDSLAFVRKVFDEKKTDSLSGSFVVTWPSWAATLEIHFRGTSIDTDPLSWMQLAGQVNGWGGNNYYHREIYSIPPTTVGGAGTNSLGWARLGNVQCGTGSNAYDARIHSYVKATFYRPSNAGDDVTTWLSECQVWSVGNGIERRAFAGMLYSTLDPSSVTLSMVNTAGDAGGKRFATGARVVAYGKP